MRSFGYLFSIGSSQVRLFYAGMRYFITTQARFQIFQTILIGKRTPAVDWNGLESKWENYYYQE